MRSSSIQGDFEGSVGILKINKRVSPRSKATKRKVVIVIQDMINIASSFNFRTLILKLLAFVQTRGLKPESVYFAFFKLQK